MNAIFDRFHVFLLEVLIRSKKKKLSYRVLLMNGSVFIAERDFAIMSVMQNRI